MHGAGPSEELKPQKGLGLELGPGLGLGLGPSRTELIEWTAWTE